MNIELSESEVRMLYNYIKQQEMGFEKIAESAKDPAIRQKVLNQKPPLKPIIEKLEAQIPSLKQMDNMKP